LNCHGQCTHCNLHVHGNVNNYRPRLLIRIGKKQFKKLESLKGIPQHYSIEEIKEKIAYYKQKIKDYESI
jgi:hypothetical protein